MQQEAISPTRRPPLSGLPFRIVRAAFVGVSRVAPGLGPWMQRVLIRGGYGLISSAMREGRDVTFMNFGYAALDGADAGDALALTPAEADERYAVALYRQVAGARDLSGRDVLEVGSGRGGGSSFIKRTLGPRTVTGVDFAAAAVKFCRKRHLVEGLTFVEGNAENLPFPDASFDVVVNVESSHCYPSFERFLRQVSRVLRPDGDFLFADLRQRNQVDDMRMLIAEVFTIVEEHCITPNVFRALELHSERRSALIERTAPALLRRPMRNFAAVEGTPAFEAFRRRDLEYFRFVLKKRR